MMVYAANLMHGSKSWRQRFDGIRRKSDAWLQKLEGKVGRAPKPDDKVAAQRKAPKVY